MLPGEILRKAQENVWQNRAALLPALIEDEDVIKKILKHLGLWDQKARPPPKAKSPPMSPDYHIDYTDSQLPVSDNFLYVDPVYPESFTT